MLPFSLHALKDESYLRQTMQRQAAQLHQASISYAVSDVTPPIHPLGRAVSQHHNLIHSAQFLQKQPGYDTLVVDAVELACSIMSMCVRVVDGWANWCSAGSRKRTVTAI